MVMRLLQKSAVNKAKAVDRQREIDEGAKLAKRVDSLRELSSVEEKNLLAFRDQTMKNVRAEIEPLYQQKQVLVQDIKGLEVQKKFLLEPLDQKWEEVTKAQQICDNWEQELTVRENFLATEKDKTSVLKASLDKRAKNIIEKEALVKEIIETATEMVANATLVLADAYKESESLKVQGETVAKTLTERETLVAIRERDVETVKTNNTKVRKENIQMSVQLADREATLERGFAELKRNQK